MQNHIRYLVVEDDVTWSRAISNAVREYFLEKQRFHQTHVKATTAYDGVQANEQLGEAKFDLVTLDMNLSSGKAPSKISGLDILGEVALGSGAYFVLIITGAVNDEALERLYGKAAAALMRYGALNEAVKRLPAERVRILHKPDQATEAAIQELLPQIESALDQYCSVSIERNIFRPFPGHAGLWEVRYNGGPRLTIPRIQPYEMIRSALSQPNREMKIIRLVQSIAHSSGELEASWPATVETLEGVSDQDDEGLDWKDLEGMTTPDHIPVDSKDGTLDLEDLIGALLLAQKQGLPLSNAIKVFVEQYGIGPISLIPRKASEYSRNSNKADQIFAMENAAEALTRLQSSILPLLAPYKAKEQAQQKTQSHGRRSKAKQLNRISWGVDTPELRLARAHWKRARAALRKYPALKEFVDHIEDCVERGITAKGRIHYSPTAGSEFTPFWLTD